MKWRLRALNIDVSLSDDLVEFEVLCTNINKWYQSLLNGGLHPSRHAKYTNCGKAVHISTRVRRTRTHSSVSDLREKDYIWLHFESAHSSQMPCNRFWFPKTHQPTARCSRIRSVCHHNCLGNAEPPRWNCCPCHMAVFISVYISFICYLRCFGFDHPNYDHFIYSFSFFFSYPRQIDDRYINQKLLLKSHWNKMAKCFKRMAHTHTARTM